MKLKYGNIIWLVFLVMALLVVYMPSLSNPLIFDDRLLSSGELFAQYGSLAELKPRLLSYGSFVWLQDVFGEGWWKQRLLNLLIHAIVVLALWGLYRQLASSIEAPQNEDGSFSHDYRESPAIGLAIGVFALNPVAVYAVAYLIQRSILMATMFVVLALWFFARGLAQGQLRWFALSVACYLLAVMSKEHAIMTPLAAVPLYILVARPSPRRLIALALGVGALVAAVGGLLVIYYGEIIGKPFDQYSRIYLAQLSVMGEGVEKNAFSLSIVNQAYLFFKYGFHWFVPLSNWMSIEMRPPFPVSFWSFPQMLGLLGFISIIATGALLLIRFRDGRSLIGFSLLLPATLFVTEFSTVWVQDPFVLYRSYLWAIGVPGIVLALFHGISRRLLLIMGVALGIGFSWQGLDRVVSMASSESVWSDAIAKMPDDPRSVGRWFPYLNRAEVYLDQGRVNEAYRDFGASSKLGDHGLGAYNIAALYGMHGKYAESLEMLNEAKRQGYSGFGLDYQRGVALYGLARYPEASIAFSSALVQDHPSPMEAIILLALGRAARATGDLAASIDFLEKARGLAPHNSEILYELGATKLSSRQFEEAVELLSLAIMDMQSPAAYHARSIANYSLKRKAEALADVEAALRGMPNEQAIRQLRDKIISMPPRME